ncbi:hypothetical protein L6452_08432 [Arctium lappa]|uniref:Uncharacterized protein n=1 Tax=Arctium lappa TaxID=4217 RepID=A0ACB9DHH7_ARCLA|nr:hypothetical protein L6452_08432 [Arctium lappa]
MNIYDHTQRSNEFVHVLLSRCVKDAKRGGNWMKIDSSNVRSEAKWDGKDKGRRVINQSVGHMAMIHLACDLKIIKIGLTYHTKLQTQHLTSLMSINSEKPTKEIPQQTPLQLHCSDPRSMQQKGRSFNSRSRSFSRARVAIEGS